ncbi:alanine-zipper protein [Virgibacillus sp. CBA3643]|uniref:alanine-zipper protein n=1 Tax=Virgibacillus sp. CBA3643 TaxID=2942278 RepID=UPI0035A33A9F
MSVESGVTITTREIYESVNNLTKEVNGLGNRFDNLESEIKKQNDQANEAQERSNEAIRLASQANNSAQEALTDSEKALVKIDEMEKNRYEEKIKMNEKEKDTRNRFYITIASALIPWLFTIGMGIIYFAQSNGF